MASGPQSKSGGAQFAPDMDFTKFFADMKLPALPDMEAFLSANRKNLETLTAANRAEGVQIFIGSENDLFAHAGCSMIITPYMNSREQVVGAIGVIGPTRLNYARIIPMVDYTAKVISKLLTG